MNDFDYCTVPIFKFTRAIHNQLPIYVHILIDIKLFSFVKDFGDVWARKQILQTGNNATMMQEMTSVLIRTKVSNTVISIHIFCVKNLQQYCTANTVI